MLKETTKKGGLGRNLSALLSQTSNVKEKENDDIHAQAVLKQLPIEKLQSGKYQPRKHFSEESLRELSNSIKQQGILQPIVVRAVANNLYEIIAGERRWRAAKMAELTQVPVLVRNISDQQALALALIENIQREDLNLMEEAYALHRLIEEFGFTHQQMAEVLGKSRTNITNMLRLLNLSPEVKIFVEQKKLDMGHARTLLILSQEQQLQVAEMVILKNLSVRETERLVKQYQLLPLSEKKKTLEKMEANPHVIHFEKKLAESLGKKVVISHGAKGAGSLTIYYNNLGELDGLVEHMA
jgi:ParB family transcriptional regulator, chromosome partitioning protein